MTDVEAAYAAGIFDGEGTVSLTWRPNRHGRRYAQLSITIGNTDVRVLQWLAERFGGSWTQQKQAWANAKPFYRWMAWTARAEAFLQIVRPHLILKAEQADLALRFRETITTRGQRLAPEVEIERLGLKAELTKLNQRGGG